jgi:site-specific DNA recombinase
MDGFTKWIMTNTTDRKIVGIWVRVSTEEAGKGESPVIHEHRARSYAQTRNWQVFTVYHLEGVSGKSVIEHPEAQRMLSDVRNGHITGLIFSKLARLGRNTRELLAIADIFNTFGADLISIYEAIDTSTPGGKFFYTILAAVAQWEREEISERIRASVSIRATLGRPLNGKATMGYVWIDKNLVPDPAKAPIRKLLYLLFAKHKRLETVARLLNDSGFRTGNGALFYCRTVRRLIKDSTPMGRHVINYTTRQEGTSIKLKPKAEWVTIPVEPIVSCELWTFCNNLLDQRGHGQCPGRRSSHIFGGLVWCVCDHKMYVPSNSPKYVCQKCHNKISISDLDIAFQELLTKEALALFKPRFYGSVKDNICDLQKLREIVAQQQIENVKELAMLSELRTTGDISRKGFLRRNGPLAERQTQLAKEHARLDNEISRLKSAEVRRPDNVHEQKRCMLSWSDLAAVGKRAVVEDLIRKITVRRSEIIFQFLDCHSKGLPQRKRSAYTAIKVVRDGHAGAHDDISLKKAEGT